MARQAIAVQEAKRSGVAVTKTAPTQVDLAIPLTGKEFLLVENGTGSPLTVTISERSGFLSNTGYADNEGGSVAAGTTEIFGPFNNVDRWKQADGNLYVDLGAFDPLIKVSALRNPDASAEGDTK